MAKKTIRGLNEPKTRAPFSWDVLRAEAKDLGIKVYKMSRDEIVAAIEAKKE